MQKQYFDWVKEYPNHVVVIKQGKWFVALNESAKVLNKVLGRTLKPNGKGVITYSYLVKPILMAFIDKKINLVVIKNDKVIIEKTFKSFNLKHLLLQGEALKPKLLNKADEPIDEQQRLLYFAKAILEKANPITGEVFAENDIICSDEVQKLVKIAEKTIKRHRHVQGTASGSKWTQAEDEQLWNEYCEKIPISEIAKIHNRSDGAINSRIVKLFFENEGMSRAGNIQDPKY